MKKRMLLRGLMGFPLGIALGDLITISSSAIVATGYYYPCVPAFVEIVGSEIGAVMLQTVLCGILGAGFAMASIIWEIESWSIVKQSAIYFTIAAFIMLPIAYITNWMEHSALGFLLYFGIFAAIFVVIWLLQYCIWKIKIQRINAKMRE